MRRQVGEAQDPTLSISLHPKFHHFKHHLVQSLVSICGVSRSVLGEGLPTDAINFAQEVGRLGRDGQGGSSYVIVPHTSMLISDATWEKGKHTTPLSQRVMQRYVSQSRCL
jgi:hypothetical protein